MASILKTDKIEGVTASGTVDLPSGSIVQQVNSADNAVTTDRAYQSTNSTSFVHMTNFDIKITPKFASSKILYIGAFNLYGNSSAGYAYLALFQHISGGSATQVSTSTATGSGVVSHSQYNQVPIVHMMTPNTTNEITYKIYAKANSSSGSVYVGWNSGAGSLDNATNFVALEIRA